MASSTLLEAAAQNAWTLPNSSSSSSGKIISGGCESSSISPVSMSSCVPLYASSCAVSALDINVYRTNKHRRTVWEMNENELWNCPTPGCRKRYRRTSSKSIESHKKTCTISNNDSTPQIETPVVQHNSSKDEMKIDQTTIVSRSEYQQGNVPVMAVIVDKPVQHGLHCKADNSSNTHSPPSSPHAPLALVQPALFNHPQPFSSSLAFAPSVPVIATTVSSSSSAAPCEDDSIDPIATLLALAHAPVPLSLCSSSSACSTSSSSCCCSPSSPASPPALLESFEGGVVDDEETESDSELEELVDRQQRKRRRTGGQSSSPSPSECSFRCGSSPALSSRVHSHLSASRFPFRSNDSVFSDRLRTKNDGLESVVVAARALQQSQSEHASFKALIPPHLAGLSTAATSSTHTARH